MPNKMLIDASHKEETRVVVTRGNRIEEFDFESQDKKQLRGNIYLARVTRVEPSLQAAFVEYGGNRHGFLAFSEIHPDYYQIPHADRQALLRAEAEAAAAEDEDEDEERNKRRRRGGGGRKREGSVSTGEDEAEAVAGVEAAASDVVSLEPFETDAETANADASDAGEAIEPAPEDLTAREDQPVEEADAERPAPAAEAALEGDGTAETGEDEAGSKPGGPAMAAEVEADVVSEALVEAAEVEAPEALTGDVEEVAAVSAEEVESVGAEDALEEVQSRRRTPRRHYKIQEVIKRRQILLVQVVKEERGNKGAALTTYLSLAGRYSVLMPNTARGGGISRKITNAADRKRLKDLVKELEVPQGMGVILRTAGENRTKPEIKRDYEYLMRMWETVRGLTLKSIAPTLVYEEGSLIKRSVRDLYNKDIEEIVVAGEEGYREAKDFMRMLMPSHAKVVQPYREATPIYAKNGVEAQLDRLLQPQVTLKSGGYIVINQTEALVSVDVNSGRSTREHSIEDTALQTNLEAAEEVARQLRLRDLAGLIVIDFIDMEEHRNNRAVEKKLKDCLKNDRARIQVGRISHFGLLEMSRQRIRASVLESTMKPCAHCGGTGYVRSDSSVALFVLRAVEEFLLKDARNHIGVRTPAATAFYLLNTKRGTLVDLENRFGVTIAIEADETVGHQHYLITRGAVAEKPARLPEVAAPPVFEEPEAEVEEEIEAEAADDEAEDTADAGASARNGEEGERKRRRRRRRRGGGRDRESAETVEAADDAEPEGEAAEGEAASAAETAGEAGPAEASASPAEADAEADGDSRKRRRGKRGGRRSRRDDEAEAADAADAAEAPVFVETSQFEDGAPGDAVAGESTPDENAPEAPAPEAAIAEAANENGERLIETSVATTSIELPSVETALPVDRIADSADDGGSSAAAVLADEMTTDEEPKSGNGAKRSRARRRDSADAPVEPVVTSPAGEAAEAEKPKKAGWWQRKSFF